MSKCNLFLVNSTQGRSLAVSDDKQAAQMPRGSDRRCHELAAGRAHNHRLVMKQDSKEERSMGATTKNDTSSHTYMRLKGDEKFRWLAGSLALTVKCCLGTFAGGYQA